MAAFSPLDAALEGFRLTRERPLPLLAWAAMRIALSFALNLLLIALFSSPLEEVAEMLREQPEDPQEALAALGAMAPALAVALPFAVVAWALLAGAIFRAVLRPADNRYFYLRLSRDELRLIGLTAIYFVLFVLTVPLISFGVGALAFVAALVGGVQLGSTVAVVLLPIVYGYLIVRLSLAGPLTFMDQRLRVFDSWRLTKGQTLPVAATYALAFLLASLVVFLLWMIIQFVVGLLHMNQFTDQESLARLMESLSNSTPTGFAISAVSEVAWVMALTLLLAPVATVARALNVAPQKAAEDFS